MSHLDFYPRSPCGERLKILLHCLPTHNFYPRSPCGERRITDGSICFDSSISIHALLAESDVSTRIDTDNNSDFYPRSPCGERRAIGQLQCILGNFYPRSPCGERRECARGPLRARAPISIHALLAESDDPSVMQEIAQQHFYPRSPCGERPRGGKTVILII